MKKSSVLRILRVDGNFRWKIRFDDVETCVSSRNYPLENMCRASARLFADAHSPGVPLKERDEKCSHMVDHEHVPDFDSIAPGAIAGKDHWVVDVSCKACGCSGVFRVDPQTEIDW